MITKAFINFSIKEVPILKNIPDTDLLNHFHKSDSCPGSWSVATPVKHEHDIQKANSVWDILKQDRRWNAEQPSATLDR